MSNQDSGTFFSLLREAIRYSSASSDKVDYYLELLNEDNYPKIKPEEAVELSQYLSEAAENLEEEILESRDSEKIYNLTNLKEFTNDLLNEAEEGALNLVLGNSQTVDFSAPVSAKKTGGNWLLDKFAGLTE